MQLLDVWNACCLIDVAVKYILKIYLCPFLEKWLEIHMIFFLRLWNVRILHILLISFKVYKGLSINKMDLIQFNDIKEKQHI